MRRMSERIIVIVGFILLVIITTVRYRGRVL